MILFQHDDIGIYVPHFGRSEEQAARDLDYALKEVTFIYFPDIQKWMNLHQSYAKSYVHEYAHLPGSHNCREDGDSPATSESEQVCFYVRTSPGFT